MILALNNTILLVTSYTLFMSVSPSGLLQRAFFEPCCAVQCARKALLCPLAVTLVTRLAPSPSLTPHLCPTRLLTRWLNILVTILVKLWQQFVISFQLKAVPQS